MYKFFITFFIFGLLGMVQNVFALENIPTKPTIIPRESWGANELYTELSSSYWQNILEKRNNASDTRTQAQKEKDARDYELSLKYINDNFAAENTVTKQENFNPNTGERYAWPLKYTDYVNAIVIHHTHSEYENSVEGMNDIYRYHSLNRAWGDIGYNYIIGYDGKIYEGRKGGEYVAAAHSRWNNYSSVGIAVMGNYESEGISQEQYTSLESLVQYLAWFYGIDFSKKYYYHRDCAGEKCDTFPLETYLDSTIVGHRDTGHTSCPGDKLYEQIAQIREDNLDFTQGFTPKKREELSYKSSLSTSQMQQYISYFQKYSEEELSQINDKINILLADEDIAIERRKKLQILRLGIMLSMKN